MLLGALGFVFGLYGIYEFYALSRMLPFLMPNYWALALFVLTSVTSLGLIYAGYRLKRTNSR